MIETTPPSVDVVLPCLAEAGALPWVLDRIPSGRRAIVVDNGSTDGSADRVRGRRRPTPGAPPLHAQLASLEPARPIRRRTGLPPRDLGPMRAARRRVVRATDAGWRVRETDMPYHPRTGRSKVTGTWLGTWRAVRDVRAVLAGTNGPTVTEVAR